MVCGDIPMRSEDAGGYPAIRLGRRESSVIIMVSAISVDYENAKRGGLK